MKKKEKDKKKEKEKEKKEQELFCMCIKSVISNSGTKVRCAFGGYIKWGSPARPVSATPFVAREHLKFSKPSPWSVIVGTNNADTADTHASDFTYVTQSLVRI